MFENIRVVDFWDYPEIMWKVKEDIRNRDNDVYIKYQLPGLDPDEEFLCDDDDNWVGCFPFGSRCLDMEKLLLENGAEPREIILINRSW